MLTITQAAQESGRQAAAIRQAVERGVIQAQKLNPRLWILDSVSFWAWHNDPQAHKRGVRTKTT